MTSNDILSQLQQDYGTAQFQPNWIAQDWNYWDMVGYPTAGTNALSFFTVPAGGVDPNLNVAKKNEQTNLVTQNQIGGDEVFIATHLRAFVLNSAKARQLGTGVSADTQFAARQLLFAQFFNALTSQGVLIWTILQKQWLIENNPWQRFAAGFGLGVVVPPSVGTGAGAAINGGANAYVANSPYDIDGGKQGDPFSLGQPVFLAPNTTFKIDITFPLGTSPSAANLYASGANQPATLWTGIILQGWKVRPRQ